MPNAYNMLTGFCRILAKEEAYTGLPGIMNCGPGFNYPGVSMNKEE